MTESVALTTGQRVILLIGFDKKIYCEVFLSNKTFFGAG